MFEISIYRGEVKPVTLVITDQNKRAVDLSGATLFLAIKRYETDDELAIFKRHSDFSMALAVQGIISFTLNRADTDESPGILSGQLRAVISGKSIFSDEFLVKIEPSTIPGPFVADGTASLPAMTGAGS